MHPHNHIRLLYRRLISVFAVADGWIDRWQEEVPGTDAYHAQSTLLSDMISAVSDVCAFRMIHFSGEGSDRSKAAKPSGNKSEPRAKENPEEIRKMLRGHLAELLRRFDHQTGQYGTSPSAGDRHESDIMEIAIRTHQVMSEYLDLLAARGKTFGEISSASRRQVYPE